MNLPIRWAGAAVLATVLTVAAVRSLVALSADDPVADLSVALTGPSVIAPGSSVTYGLLVRNAGPEPARGVVVTDTLPSPLAFVTASDGGLPLAPDSVRWTLGRLEPGQERMLGLTAAVPVTATVGRVVNRAFVSSATLDPNGSDNAATHGSDVMPVDLRVAVETEAPEVRPGDLLTHTVSVVNAGVVEAQGILVSVALSPHTAWVRDDATSATNGFTRALAAEGVRWHRPRLPGPSSRQIALVARVARDAPPGATIAHTATVAALTRDNVPANNAATSLPVQVRWPDLWISKTGPTDIAIGSTATFTLRFGNRGPASAPSVRVTDTLPAGLEFVDAVPPATPRGLGVVTWDVGDLPPGDEAQVRLRASLPFDTAVGIRVSNVATVGSTAPDLAPADNRAEATATVAAGVPASVTIRAPDSLAVGGDAGAIRVDVVDGVGHPVADGTAVMLDTTMGRLAVAGATTRGGIVTATLEPGTVAGSARLTARSGSVTAEAHVDVLPGPTATMGVTAAPGMVFVSEPVSVRLDARDRYGNPVRDGTAVTLAVDAGTVDPETVTTEAGLATAVWVNTRSGGATATASAVGVTTTITASVGAEFLPAPPDRVRVEAEPSALPLSTGTASVTARVSDRYGNPVADGTKVAFSASGGTVQPADATTVSGVAASRFTAGPRPGPASVSAASGTKTGRRDLEVRPADLALAFRLDGPRGRARDSRTYPGEPLTYTLAIRNQDLATARGVFLALGLPEALEVRAVTSDRPVTPTTDPPPGLMPGIGADYVDRAWALPDLAAGQALTVTLVGSLSREREWQAFQTLFARGAVTTTTAEATPADLLQSDQAGVYGADYFVATTLNYGASVVEPGGRLRYDLAFGNNTIATDGTARITETLPAYTRYDRWEPAIGTTVREASAFTVSDRHLVWEADGPSAKSGLIRLWLTVDADAPPQSIVRNKVAIGASVFDHDLDNNVSEDGGVWLAGVNLAAEVEVPERAAPGDAVTFRLRIGNAAQRDTATNVEVVAEPPTGVRLVDTQPPALRTGDGRLSWRQEVLSAGGEVILDATFQVPENAAPGTVLLYRAVATSDQLESYPVDNTVTASVRVTAGPPHAVALGAGATRLTACSNEETTVTATIRDRFGNVVSDGTPVRWSVVGVALVDRDSETVDGVATATVRAGRSAGPAGVRLDAEPASGSVGMVLVPGPPRALALTADPRIVPRGGRTRIAVGVLDGCGNSAADGWPVVLAAERGAFEGGALSVTIPTSAGAVRATLRVGNVPGPLRVTAGHGGEIGETNVTVSSLRAGLLVPFVAR